MSADPTGDLVNVYSAAFNAARHLNGGGKHRAAIEAVERAVNLRWLDMLPPGSLMCAGCDDIVPTPYRCDNCMTAEWAGRIGDGKCSRCGTELRSSERGVCADCEMDS